MLYYTVRADGRPHWVHHRLVAQRGGVGLSNYTMELRKQNNRDA